MMLQDKYITQYSEGTVSKRWLNYRSISGACIILFLVAFAASVDMSYFRLHLFVLLPSCWLLFSPPGLLRWASPAVRRLALLLPIPLAAMAVFFSAFWDNLIFSKGVFTFNKEAMVGTFMHLPLEEWFWFIDHTFLSAYFLMFLLKPEAAPPVKPGPNKWIPAILTVSALISASGIWLMLHPNEHYLFLGVNLGFMFPVLALHWWVGLHILLNNKTAWFLGILCPSLYLLGLDYWALQEGIWFLSPDYITGIMIMGVHLEQILIYTLPSILVTQSALIIIRQIERIHNRRANGEVLTGKIIAKEILARRL